LIGIDGGKEAHHAAAIDKEGPHRVVDSRGEHPRPVNDGADVFVHLTGGVVIRWFGRAAVNVLPQTGKLELAKLSRSELVVGVVVELARWRSPVRLTVRDGPPVATMWATWHRGRQPGQHVQVGRPDRSLVTHVCAADAPGSLRVW
jgi:hypothetical protein